MKDEDSRNLSSGSRSEDVPGDRHMKQHMTQTVNYRRYGEPGVYFSISDTAYWPRSSLKKRAVSEVGTSYQVQY